MAAGVYDLSPPPGDLPTSSWKSSLEKNAAFVLDVLGARLAFERTGVSLYDNAIVKIERYAEPRYHVLLEQLREIRAEEKEHEEWLEAQIRSLGGTAHETTDMAELETLESSGIRDVIVDGHHKVIHILHALLAAELADNAGWDLLVKLADEARDHRAKLQFAKRLAEEAKHLLFLREAVVRAAEIEMLGLDIPMPSGMGGVVARSMKKPLVLGGAVLLGIGALTASALLRARARRPLHA